jgi:hypothetical protein
MTDTELLDHINDLQKQITDLSGATGKDSAAQVAGALSQLAEVMLMLTRRMLDVEADVHHALEQNQALRLENDLLQRKLREQMRE